MAESADFVHETLCDSLKAVPRFEIPNGRAFRGLHLKILERRLRQEDCFWRAVRRDVARRREPPRETALARMGAMHEPEDGLESEEQIARGSGSAWSSWGSSRGESSCSPFRGTILSGDRP